MSAIVRFKGFIRDIRYRALMTTALPSYPLETFDVNRAAPAGLLATPDGTIGFSKWVSPKRTRSYPFERIYRTYNAPKIITIIPVIKDEGARGDLDKIQASTISWMNLLNIYIVLGYYDSAERNSRQPGKITRQKFNEAHIRAQIEEILSYKQSALHWNRTLIQERFLDTFESALEAYTQIARYSGIPMHEQNRLRMYAAALREDLQQFWQRSLRASQEAAQRESATFHRLEVLGDGSKGIFELENYLGGIYHLTADEILTESGVTIIQESKNSSRTSLPSLSDIRDGLFKLILFANIHRLETELGEVQFKTRLKLTGVGIQGVLNLPCDEPTWESFQAANRASLRAKQMEIVKGLRLEVDANRNLEVQIREN